MLSFNQIKEWSKMSLAQRYNMLLGAVVVVLVAVIIFLKNDINDVRAESRDTINGVITRYTAREAALEAKLEVCNQERLERLIKSEKEYRDLLFEAKKLKEKLEK